ncbi:MAG: RDD family protein, partial [Phycisphaerae bacterium]|nr:RDD family protein [Phycisphaerae bacterium]
PITLAEIEGGAAVAWFRTGPKLIDEQSGLRVRAIDPVSGEVGDPEAIEPARTSLVEWIHLPILGATVVAILMIVFFVRSLRQEPVTKLPTGWEPAPLSRRLVALAIDLAPIAVAVKIATGSSWSRLLVPPALVIDTEAAVPAFALIFLTVAVTGVSEAIFARSFGKLVVGVRVIDARTQEGARPSIVQTLGRNVFKAVILQLPVLGIFTLLDPLRQGIGESVSSTAVVRRIARVHTAPIG